jgi:hypothetical protein
MTPESCNLPICWTGLRWARSRGNMEGAAAERRIVGSRFHINEYDWRSNALHAESRRFLGNACRNVPVHTATNLHSTAVEKSAITLLLKEVISIRFDQNLPQGENWPTEVRIRQKTNRSQTEVFSLCGVVTVTFGVLSLFVVTKCYGYSTFESVIINCSSARWTSYKSIHLIRNPLITCRVTRISNNINK